MIGLLEPSYGSTVLINCINPGDDNAKRWMTKPKDLPLYVVQAGITGEPSRNVFEPPSNDFFTYLSDYFVDSIMQFER